MEAAFNFMWERHDSVGFHRLIERPADDMLAAGFIPFMQCNGRYLSGGNRVCLLVLAFLEGHPLVPVEGGSIRGPGRVMPFSPEAYTWSSRLFDMYPLPSRKP